MGKQCQTLFLWAPKSLHNQHTRGKSSICEGFPEMNVEMTCSQSGKIHSNFIENIENIVI